MKIELLKAPQMLTYRLKVEHEGLKYNVTVWIDSEKLHKFADWEINNSDDGIDREVSREIADAIIKEVDKQWDKLTMA